MKKLQVKTTSGWAYVFCRNLDTGHVTTTPNKRQALPSLGLWGADDLAYFQRHFTDQTFRLAADLEDATV